MQGAIYFKTTVGTSSRPAENLLDKLISNLKTPLQSAGVKNNVGKLL